MTLNLLLLDLKLLQSPGAMDTLQTVRHFSASLPKRAHMRVHIAVIFLCDREKNRLNAFGPVADNNNRDDDNGNSSNNH